MIRLSFGIAKKIEKRFPVLSGLIIGVFIFFVALVCLIQILLIALMCMEKFPNVILCIVIISIFVFIFWACNKNVSGNNDTHNSKH